MGKIILDNGQAIKSSTGIFYRKISNLGKGGNSTAFLVLCTSEKNCGILFVLKIFLNIEQKVRKEKFLTEIEFLEKTDHPAVVKIYDKGEFGVKGVKYPFTVTEYYPVTMFDIMHNDLTQIEKIGYVINILSALKYLNSLDRKIIHRDIKPQNIFIKAKNAILGDFGLMKVLDSDESDISAVEKEIELSKEPGMAFSYRTPDLVDYLNCKGKLTTKSDIFQFGLVVYQLFTGWNPCEKTTNIKNPVILKKDGNIDGKYGDKIKHLIEKMLIYDVSKRTDHHVLLDDWNRLYQDITKEFININGKLY